jgi:hypothetical protein
MDIAPNENSQDEQQRQPDQEALKKRKKQQYQHAYHRQHRVRLTLQKRKRYKKDPTPFYQAHRKWVVKNRERRRAYQKRWYQQKLETLRSQHRDYYARFRGTRTYPQQGVLQNASCGSTCAAAPVLQTKDRGQTQRSPCRYFLISVPGAPVAPNPPVSTSELTLLVRSPFS